MADKDLEGIFAPLARRARRVLFAAPASPRAAAPGALRERLGRRDASALPSVAAAVAELEAEGPSAAPALATGSLYLVGEVLALISPA
jgi:folylpolyglutamate synthase/dihydropteroate synthase